MATAHSDVYRESGGNHEADSRTASSAPLLDEDVSESTPAPAQTTDDVDTESQTVDPSTTGEKSSKRKFWTLGKKKVDNRTKDKSDTPTSSLTSAPLAPIATMRPVSPLHSPDVRGSASPGRVRHPYGSPASPARNLHSSSPRPNSPASSQIFERSVQEDFVPSQASPAIPSHIVTENHIPPVLDASSAAITDDHLDPDTVEIITHAAHQPASVTVTGTGDPPPSMSASFSLDAGAHQNDFEDTAFSYATLNTNDVRRLSFVSFSDVVHAEHSHDQEHHGHLPSRGSVHNLTGLSTSTSIAPPRSPSPLHSPISSHGAADTSPPTSVSPSFKGIETSPSRGVRGSAGSPLPLLPHSPPLGGELNIETMRQALRKTGSGDLSGVRSQPMSAIGDGPSDGEGPFGRSLR
jgi:hypothetical protein